MRIYAIFTLWVLIAVSVVPALGQATAESWFEKGNQFFANGSNEDAVKAYDKAIGLNSSYVEAWYNKGSALQKLGRNSDADKAFNKSEELFSKAQTSQENSIVSPTTALDAKNPSNEVKVPEKHTYTVGTPGINEFILNWTDNKVYSSKIDPLIFDERDDNLDVYLTKYSVWIRNESETNVTLYFYITWHPSVKRPSTFTLENFPYKLDTDGVLSRSEVTIQGKKALMLTYKDKKEYQGSESKPRITPTHYLVRYFLDDYTEIGIEGELVNWPVQEFKSMLNSMKITPPDGYY
jgi:tetratricopeptide (TPR) repeat protein